MFSASFVLLAVLAAPREFSMADFWERKCAAGEATACARLENVKRDAVKLERLDRLARRYGAAADRPALERDDGKPRLNLAYKQVMADFIEAEQAAGDKALSYDAESVDYCAGHFHNYWLNRKLWWPTDDAGAPDWTSIYYYIVDHYHGICLRRYFTRH